MLSFDYTDTAGNVAETITRRIDVVDNAAPVIVLNGDTNITHEAGTTTLMPMQLGAILWMAKVYCMEWGM